MSIEECKQACRLEKDQEEILYLDCLLFVNYYIHNDVEALQTLQRIKEQILLQPTFKYMYLFILYLLIYWKSFPIQFSISISDLVEKEKLPFLLYTSIIQSIHQFYTSSLPQSQTIYDQLFSQLVTVVHEAFSTTIEYDVDPLSTNSNYFPFLFSYENCITLLKPYLILFLDQQQHDFCTTFQLYKSLVSHLQQDTYHLHLKYSFLEDLKYDIFHSIKTYQLEQAKESLNQYKKILDSIHINKRIYDQLFIDYSLLSSYYSLILKDLQQSQLYLQNASQLCKKNEFLSSSWKVLFFSLYLSIYNQHPFYYTHLVEQIAHKLSSFPLPSYIFLSKLFLLDCAIRKQDYSSSKQYYSYLTTHIQFFPSSFIRCYFYIVLGKFYSVFRTSLLSDTHILNHFYYDQFDQQLEQCVSYAYWNEDSQLIIQLYKCMSNTNSEKSKQYLLYYQYCKQKQKWTFDNYNAFLIELDQSIH